MAAASAARGVARGDPRCRAWHRDPRRTTRSENLLVALWGAKRIGRPGDVAPIVDAWKTPVPGSRPRSPRPRPGEAAADHAGGRGMTASGGRRATVRCAAPGPPASGARASRLDNMSSRPTTVVTHPSWSPARQLVPSLPAWRPRRGCAGAMRRSRPSCAPWGWHAPDVPGAAIAPSDARSWSGSRTRSRSRWACPPSCPGAGGALPDEHHASDASRVARHRHPLLGAGLAPVRPPAPERLGRHAPAPAPGPRPAPRRRGRGSVASRAGAARLRQPSPGPNAAIGRWPGVPEPWHERPCHAHPGLRAGRHVRVAGAVRAGGHRRERGGARPPPWRAATRPGCSSTRRSRRATRPPPSAC